VPEELDREYVINGDDLRIGLAGIKGIANSAEIAGYIVGKYAAPLGAPVDAHICCEHAGDAPGPFSDPEVAAMAALAPALAALRRLKHDEAMRVMRWATDRATGNLPPF
jgi:hypothetical protein